jgi:hypothetical protein
MAELGFGRERKRTPDEARPGAPMGKYELFKNKIVDFGKWRAKIWGSW